MAVAQAESRTSRRAVRAKPPRHGVGRRIAAGVAGIALAAAAVYAQQNFAMSYEQRTSYLTYKGRIGETVETKRFTVKVLSVTAARAVDTTDYSDKVSKVATGNLFLLVDVSATSAREPFKLSRLNPPVLLTEDGRRYQPTDKVNDTLTLFNKYIQPGFWSSGLLVFEVPPNAVADASLVFIPPVSPLVSDNYAPEAQIDLGLSRAAAARLIAQAEDYHSLVSASR
ncbi:hypothetical protein GCM10010116_58580 [Microbispora rosea subsp. aerata]|nr:DUF4352 domain-containing protein [Microbispora rosea]GGO29248.1 hypothetical protein GCM10010116_58580 [Microbispora rosea subsp. aerata]GIH58844.1 hypothetical protein Mro02_57580 [Microbispora rosea subsp. aerata]GLJ83325.1 hypothetical protein GCM10017588_20520 [Microbispora rosea subsp. aerata]